MKKHDEGYALPFVIVVMLVLCLVAVSVMSFSLRNLQSQKASIEQMEAQYQAQGELEKMIVELNDTISAFVDNIATSNYTYTEVGLAALQADLQAQLGDGVAWDARDCRVTLTAVYQSTQVTSTLLLKDVIRSGVDGGTQVYVPSLPASISYETYSISTIEPAEGGGDGAQ